MNICNCYEDLNKYFCDVPSKWRDAIVEALCFYFNERFKKDVSSKQTLTKLNSFSLEDGYLVMSYLNEDNFLKKSKINLYSVLNSTIPTSSFCFPISEDHVENLIEQYCRCCPSTTTTTTTSSSTTTTTTLPCPTIDNITGTTSLND